MDSYSMKKDDCEKRLKTSENSYKRVQVPTSYMPARSTRPLTEPKPFNFHSSSRKDQNVSSPCKEQYVSMAEKVEAFCSRTPERFHSNKQNKLTSTKSSSNLHQGITIPKSPNLATSTRARAYTKPKSTVEIEEDARKFNREHPFKAKPVNQRIMESQGDLGVPRIKPAPTTEAIGFSFSTDRRVNVRRERANTIASNEGEKVKPFVARAFNKEMFKSVSGLPSKHMKEATIPSSPKITGPSIHRLLEQAAEASETIPEFKAQPLPDFTHSFHPNLEHKHTVPEPFPYMSSYPDPSEIKSRLVEAEIQKENEVRVFKAHPVEHYESNAFTSNVEYKAPTVPKPFEFATDKIIEKSKAMMAEKSKLQNKEEKMMREFKAHGCSVLTHQPFVPEKSSKPLTEINEFPLKSGARGVVRAAFDAEFHHRALKAEEEQAERDAIQHQEDQKSILLMRKERVHKANPVHYYKHVEVHASTQRLTEPCSPAFSEKRKGLL